MPKIPKILLTGGGSAGHVTAHLAILPKIREKGWDVVYIGSNGIEKSIIKKAGIRFLTIPAGKLRRYFSFQNFLDVFKVGLGLIFSYFYIAREKPDLVFSKGGFVSVPVCIAAWLQRIPVITHESDFTPGLATKIILRFAKQTFYAFPQTARFLPMLSSKYVGQPVRDEVLGGSREKGLEIGAFKNPLKPTLLIMGGSLGAQKINELIEKLLPTLTLKFNIIHITGQGKSLFKKPQLVGGKAASTAVYALVNEERSNAANTPNGALSTGSLSIASNGDAYKSFEFVHDELKHLLAASDFIISRAGANSIFEFLALKRPMLLIPLEAGSRGDQVKNAEAFSGRNWAILLREKDLNEPAFTHALDALVTHAEDMKKSMETESHESAASLIVKELERYLPNNKLILGVTQNG